MQTDTYLLFPNSLVLRQSMRYRLTQPARGSGYTLGR